MLLLYGRTDKKKINNEQSLEMKNLELPFLHGNQDLLDGERRLKWSYFKWDL